MLGILAFLWPVLNTMYFRSQPLERFLCSPPLSLSSAPLPSPNPPGPSASTSLLPSLGQCLLRWWSTEPTPSCTKTTSLRNWRASPTSAAYEAGRWLEVSTRMPDRGRELGPPALWPPDFRVEDWHLLAWKAVAPGGHLSTSGILRCS